MKREILYAYDAGRWLFKLYMEFNNKHLFFESVLAHESNFEMEGNPFLT